MHYIAQALLCVLVERDLAEGVFSPSKLCDYISAKKPVLALSPGVGCVADLAATERGVKRVGPGDTPAIASALVEMFDAFVGHRLESHGPSGLLVSRHEKNRVIGEFLNVVSPLTLNARCKH
jgi:hypothetical protein